jgi:hypothetical protein
MDNLGTNDSNKNLLDETSEDRTDAEVMKEQEGLKTEPSEIATSDADVQDSIQHPGDVRKTSERS